MEKTKRLNVVNRVKLTLLSPELAPSDLPFGETFAGIDRDFATDQFVEDTAGALQYLGYGETVAFGLDIALSALTGRKPGALTHDQRRQLQAAIFSAGAMASREVDAVAPEWIAKGLHAAMRLVELWSEPLERREAGKDAEAEAIAYVRVLRHLLRAAHLLELVDERKAARAAASGISSRAA